MFAPNRILAAALLAFSAAFGSGCTHLGPLTAATDAHGRAVYSSTVRYADGTPRTTVTETVMGSDSSCDILRIERRFYDQTGMLIERTTDRERCAVVEARITEIFDPIAAVSTRISMRDTNHDGQFDTQVTSSRGLDQAELAALRN